MAENKGYRAMAIIALVLGVIGVTLGYAAFENTLTITTTAEVNPDPSKFNVDFSTSNAAVVDGTEVVTPTLSDNNVDGFEATDATLNNASNPTATNLHATFTEPGQTVTYQFYAYNAGEYIAYLKSITFDTTNTQMTCTARTGTTQALVDSACNGITLSVQVGATGPATASVATVTNHPLAIGGAEQVTVTITYAQGSAIADGDFDVTFPDIVLNYKSVD